MLLAAIVGGYAGVFVRLPRVVGYLVSGVLLHLALRALPGWSDASPRSATHLFAAAENLDGIKTLALGLIMFSIGGVFQVQHLRTVGPKILRISLPKIICVLVLVGGGCTLLQFVSGARDPQSAIALGILLGVVGVATAPAATLLVLREYEAKGPNSDAILTMTAINNIVCIVLFHASFLLMAAGGMIESGLSPDRLLWVDLLLNSVGSMLLGVVLGFAFSVLYAKITIADFMLVFLGVLVVMGTFRAALSESLHLSFNFLLTTMFLGAVFANITPDREAFHKALHTISGPIFALFFVLAGFELHLDSLQHLGLLGAGYVLLRVCGKTLGGWIGVRWSHARAEFRSFIGFGMLCQAGVAIGLADFLYGSWGTAGPDGFRPAAGAAAFKAIVLGSVVVFELIGPVALKRVAIISGEVKAVTLLRRRRTPGNDSDSVVRLTWEALLRTLRFGRPREVRASGPLQVRHIMRSNVNLLSAAARFDEVLRFVEGSRHNHFPVVDEHGDYVGMIHYADLRNMIYDPALRDLVTALDLARSGSAPVPVDLPLSDLLHEFHESDVGSLAVVDRNDSRRVVGIVEQRDVLLALHAPER